MVQWWQAWLSDSSQKACLSPWGSFCLETGVGFVYDLIIGNSRLSKRAAHFKLQFCTNMHSSLNMKMTDTATVTYVNNQSRDTSSPCDWWHTFARQSARIIQTTLNKTPDNYPWRRNISIRHSFWASVTQWFHFLTSRAIRMHNKSGLLQKKWFLEGQF